MRRGRVRTPPVCRLLWLVDDVAADADHLRVHAVQVAVGIQDAGGDAVAPALCELARRVAERGRLDRAVALDICDDKQDTRRASSSPHTHTQNGAPT